MPCRVTGRRLDHRPGQVRHRDAGGAIKPLHYARALASRSRLSTDAPDEERSCTLGLRSRHDGQCTQRTVATLPAELWQSLTWDRGKELSDHARFSIESGVRVFFADPRSPWQRGTNENTNGLLRQYFPKGTDLSRWSEQEIQAVARTLNNRPRKTLGWKTPAETLNQYLKSVRQPGVATTG